MTDTKNLNKGNIKSSETGKKRSFFGGEINLKTKDLLDFRYNTQEEIDKLNEEMNTNNQLDDIVYNDNMDNDLQEDTENKEQKNNPDQQGAIEGDVVEDIALNNIEEEDDDNENIEEFIKGNDEKEAESDLENNLESIVDDVNIEHNVDSPEIATDEEGELSNTMDLSNAAEITENDIENNTNKPLQEKEIEDDENIEEDTDENAKFFDPFELGFDENEEDEENTENNGDIFDPFGLEDNNIESNDTSEIIDPFELDEEGNDSKIDNDNKESTNNSTFDNFGDNFSNDVSDNEPTMSNDSTESYSEESHYDSFNVDQDLNTEENIEENSNKNTEKNADEDINEEDIDENIEENTDKNIEEDTNENIEENTDENVEKNNNDDIMSDTQENAEEHTEENIDNNIDNHAEENDEKHIDEYIDENISEDSDENVEKNTEENIEENTEEENKTVGQEIQEFTYNDNNKEIYVNQRKAPKYSANGEIITNDEIELEQGQDMPNIENQEEYQPSDEEIFEREPEFFADDELSQEFMSLVQVSRDIFKLERKDGEQNPYFKILGGKSDNLTLEYLFYLIEEEDEPIDLFIKKVESNSESGDEMEHLVQFSYNEEQELNIFVDEIILYEKINKSEKDSSEYSDTKAILKKFLFLAQTYHDELIAERNKQHEERQKKRQLQQIFKGF